MAYGRTSEATLNSTGQPAGRSRGPRQDAVRNRNKLLDAVGAILESEPASVSMPLVARQADLSTATAYRYFSTLEELISAYVYSTIVELRNFSHDCPKTGTALFEAVAAERVRLVRRHGAATVQVRSRQGFLARLQAQDHVITAVRDIWERPIRAAMRQLGVTDEHFDHALFLYNIMFDPRDILDLVATGLDEATVVRRLTRAYYGAVRGWVDADSG
ncbi:TetR/AcrR family transcriptional regulator [Streptomyces sp. NBC_00006]|uniref:TetR/AcrR family transcriptional regulator n=1 Tax=Streptomyces sp. NBC_00006 TaxID=2975619 RepID=UPI002258EA40|nr:TetR/AcrR family transcriptional regulator [Streptomyces sp. NBC_00006]MCX5535565.1 TetR/AcrR family transcriptional regulator [Streptomyces sp. NBC_00006]